MGYEKTVGKITCYTDYPEEVRFCSACYYDTQPDSDDLCDICLEQPRERPLWVKGE